MTDTARPTWDEVMDEFRALPLEQWHAVRREAADCIEQDHAEAGLEGHGISSSDINHTVFGVAEWHYRQGLRGLPLAAATIATLEEMT